MISIKQEREISEKIQKVLRETINLLSDKVCKLQKEKNELKEENDFLLKRVEELENNLCPSCGKM